MEPSKLRNLPLVLWDFVREEPYVIKIARRTYVRKSRVIQILTGKTGSTKVDRSDHVRLRYAVHSIQIIAVSLRADEISVSL